MPNDTRRTIEDVVLAKTVLDTASTKRKVEELQRNLKRQQETMNEQAYEAGRRREYERENQFRRDAEERSRRDKQEQMERDRLKEIKYLTENPKLFEAKEHYNTSINCTNAGLIDEAITELKKAIDCKPDFIDAYLQLSSSYLTKIQIIAKNSTLDQLRENQDVFELLGKADINIEKATKLKKNSEVLNSEDIQQVIQNHLEISYPMGLKNIKDKWLDYVYKFAEYKIDMQPHYLSPIIQALDCLLFIHEEERAVSLLSRYKERIQNYLNDSSRDLLTNIKVSSPERIIKLCISVKEALSKNLEIIEQLKKWCNEKEISSKQEVLKLLEDEKAVQINFNDTITMELQKAEEAIRSANLIEEQKEAEEQKQQEEEQRAKAEQKIKDRQVAQRHIIFKGSIIGAIIGGIGGAICGAIGSANGGLGLIFGAVVGFFDFMGIVIVIEASFYIRGSSDFGFFFFAIISVIIGGWIGVGGDLIGGIISGTIFGALGSAFAINWSFQ